jgi:hypothetical protein
VLLDSGSDCAIMSKAFAQKLRLSWLPDATVLQVADNSKAKVLGRTRPMQLRLASGTAGENCIEVAFLVVDHTGLFNILLGQREFHKWGARGIDMVEEVLSYRPHWHESGDTDTLWQVPVRCTEPIAGHCTATVASYRRCFMVTGSVPATFPTMTELEAALPATLAGAQTDTAIAEEPATATAESQHAGSFRNASIAATTSAVTPDRHRSFRNSPTSRLPPRPSTLLSPTSRQQHTCCVGVTPPLSPCTPPGAGGGTEVLGQAQTQNPN